MVAVVEHVPGLAGDCESGAIGKPEATGVSQRASCCCTIEISSTSARGAGCTAKTYGCNDKGLQICRLELVTFVTTNVRGVSRRTWEARGRSTEPELDAGPDTAALLGAGYCGAAGGTAAPAGPAWSIGVSPTCGEPAQATGKDCVTFPGALRRRPAPDASQGQPTSARPLPFL